MSLVTVYENDTHKKQVYKSSLSSVKEARKDRVKEEASERIASLDWMIQRAERHSILGKSVKKSKDDVLQLQQDIEEASDLAESAIDLLTTASEIKGFTW